MAEPLVPLIIALLATIGGMAAIWLPYLPNARGDLGVDYAYWLPNLLAGDFWHITNGWHGVPWFSPAACGGTPLYANPQGAYFSLVQWLTFALGPIRALQANFLIYGAAGFAGATALARSFRLSTPACLLAAVLFTLNRFFAVRMMVGHLSFAPFMLTPALAACCLGPGSGWAATVLRCAGIGALTAVMLQAGMAVLMPPVFLCVLIILVMHALATGDRFVPPLVRLAAGTATGLLLCAGKLAAVGALMANLPRNAYPLPGFPKPLLTAWVALRGLFFWPSADATHALVNSPLRFELHEWDSGVGPAPLLLLAAAGWVAWRGGGRLPAALRPRLLIDALALLLLVPIALNTYAPGWTPFLKMLPVIGSSSSLLRWFAAYILPACLAGGLALDGLARRVPATRWQLTAPTIALTVLALLAMDRRFYGAGGIGVYDPRPIVAAWAQGNATGRAPPITGITMSRDAQGAPAMTLAGQNALAEGLSQLKCYEPLFGYRQEFFPGGPLHPGSVFDVTGNAAQGGNRLNLKNPACYVFPLANACQPGDAFPASGLDNAADFLAYRPYAWNEPAWARDADRLNLAALGLWGIAVLAALARWLRPPGGVSA